MKIPKDHFGWIFYLSAGVLVLSLVLGGGTRNGFLADTLLQASALPLLILVLWQAPSLMTNKATRWAVLVGVIVALIPLLQLIPLPPSLWTQLPQRDQLQEIYNLVNVETPWMGISVEPDATWLSLLSLIPPLAIFWSLLFLSHNERRALCGIFVAMGVANIVLGLMQIAGGPTSALRFFEITSPSLPVGIFANRNHFAALLYSLLMFVSAWTVVAGARIDLRASLRDHDSAMLLKLLTLLVSTTVIVAMAVATRSRAGLLVTVLAFFGIYLVALSVRTRRRRKGYTRVIAVALLLGLVLAAQATLYQIIEAFAQDPLQDQRLTFARNTMEAIRAYLPFGSGMGTFVSVYGAFEKPEDLMPITYVNRAHNDYLELALEAGLPGLAALAVLGLWFAKRCIAVWRGGADREMSIDKTLQKAASIVVLLIAAHSSVEYPLRTGGMLAVMALALGMLTPVSRANVVEAVQPMGLPANPETDPGRTASPNAVRERRAKGLWGEDVDWPEEWQPPDRSLDDGSEKKE